MTTFKLFLAGITLGFITACNATAVPYSPIYSDRPYQVDNSDDDTD